MDYYVFFLMFDNVFSMFSAAREISLDLTPHTCKPFNTWPQQSSITVLSIAARLGVSLQFTVRHSPNFQYIHLPYYRVSKELNEKFIVNYRSYFSNIAQALSSTPFRSWSTLCQGFDISMFKLLSLLHKTQPGKVGIPELH